MSKSVSEPLPEAPVGELGDATPSGKPESATRRKDKIRARIVQGVSLLGLVIVILLLWHFLGDKSNKAANRPRSEVVPVEMTRATQMDVPVQIKSIGNIEPLSTIAVRSQIEGTLQSV